MQYVVMDEYGQFTVVDEIHGAEVHDDRYYKKEEIYWLVPVNTYDDLPLTGNQHGDTRLILADKNVYVWIEEAGYDEDGDPVFVGDWLSVIGNYWSEPVASLDDLPLTGNLDGEVRLVEDQNVLFRWNESTSTWVSIVAASWRAPVDTYDDLPLTGNTDGDVKLVLDTNRIYRWSSGTTEDWLPVGESSIQDTDGDTLVQLEESADEDKIRLDVNGSEVMIITDGKVGIGTDSPTEVFEVFPDTDVSAIIGKARIGYYNAGDYASFGHQDLSAMTDPAVLQNSSGLTIINAKGGQTLRFHINNERKMTLDSAGKFGIGIATPVPKFQVGDATGGDGEVMRLGWANGANKETLIGLSYYNDPYTQPPISLGYRVASNGWAGQTKGHIVFQTRDVTTNTEPTERMRITDDGKVGIGTDSPGAPLDIKTTDAAGAQSLSKLQIGRDAYDAIGDADFIDWKSGATVLNRIGGIISAAGKMDMSFSVYDAGVQERMRIKYDGTVTIEQSLTLTNNINEFSTDGTLGGDSDSAVPTEKATKTYVDDRLPIGSVIMYDGTGIADVGSRTEDIGDRTGDTISLSGWKVCNGNGGAPNLINKFIRSEAASGNTGGEDTHALTEAELATHTHTQNSHIHAQAFGSGAAAGWSTAMTLYTNMQAGYGNTAVSATTATNNNTGSGTAHENKPAYYSLIYIKRVS